MPFVNEFLDFMVDRVGVEPYLSRDAYGNKTYGPLVSYAGRVVNKRRVVINKAGAEAVSETTIYLAAPNGVGFEDRITLPSGLLPAHPPIITVGRSPDEYGDRITTVYA